jgi:hypothetical protein
MKSSDGVAQIAVGLGKSVVEGFEALRFCPRHPQVLPQFSSVKDILRNAQRRFYALDMSQHDVIPGLDLDSNLCHLDASVAIEDGVANPILSTYQRADDRIVSGYSGEGAPLVTFAPLLRGRVLPLPDLLTQLLEICQKGIASPVEIEFAANLRAGLGQPQVFNVVQLRPMVVEKMEVDVQVDTEVMERALVRSDTALGHGRRETISDLVVVDPRSFNRSSTGQAATFIEALNRELRAEKRQCILIGPGRWGSRDPWLGIPVAWSQISAARAIVETDFDDLQVEPSLGSHFFHNLTCFGIAFFAVHALANDGWINWEWFDKQPAVTEGLGGTIRHLRLDDPVQVLVDGSSGRGVILESVIEH